MRVYARLFSGHYMNMRNGNYSLSLSLSRTILLSAHTFRILEVSFSKNQFEIRNWHAFYVERRNFVASRVLVGSSTAKCRMPAQIGF